MPVLLAVLWFFYAMAISRWSKSLAREAIRGGASDPRKIRSIVSRSIFLRLTIHFSIIGTLFCFGADTPAHVSEIAAHFVFAWIVMCLIAIFVYNRGIALVLRETDTRSP